MTSPTIRPAYSEWPRYNRELRAAVARWGEAELEARPAQGRWPLWATVGHLACQRVSWLCGFAGEPGAETTPFPDALRRCPGDEYLEPRLDALQLVGALDTTFRVVEGVLDGWTFDRLDQEIRRDFGDEPWVLRRGEVVQRVFAHDLYHIAELNETLGAIGAEQVDLWG